MRCCSAMPEASANGSGIPGSATSTFTVLVADDNEVAQRLCKRVLEKAGFAVFGVLNTPEPLLAKNCASTVVVVTVWIGVTHEIVLVFDVSGVPRYVAVPCAVSSPRFAPRYVKVADPLASVGASALVAFTPATARCTARPAIGTPFVSFAVTVSCCDVPVTFGPAFAGASTRVAPAPDEVTLVVNVADTGP